MHPTHIGQSYRYPPEKALYIVTYLIFLRERERERLAAQFPFISPQNVVYFIILTSLVHKIFTVYINGVPKFKCSAPGPKG